MVLAQVDLDFVDQLITSFSELGASIGRFLPRLIAALLVLLVGRWIAKFIRTWTERILEKVGLSKVTRAGGIEGMLEQAGTTSARLVATVAYYLILVVFIQVAAEVLGIDRLTALLDTLIGYLPLLIVAILIVFVASAVANWAARMIQPFAESRGVPWLDNVVKYAILVIGVLAALDTMNFAPEVMARVQDTLLQYLPLSVLVAATVAFGVGGIDTAREWWKKYLTPGSVGNNPPGT